MEKVIYDLKKADRIQVFAYLEFVFGGRLEPGSTTSEMMDEDVTLESG